MIVGSLRTQIGRWKWDWIYLRDVCLDDHIMNARHKILCGCLYYDGSTLWGNMIDCYNINGFKFICRI